jgi:hypothetical protein
MNAIERFWSRVDKTGDCWVWLGAKSKDGYGIYATASKHGIFHSNYTHRLSYYLAYGDFDTSL